MNTAVLRKPMGNVRKQIDIKLVTTIVKKRKNLKIYSQ